MTTPGRPRAAAGAAGEPVQAAFLAAGDGERGRVSGVGVVAVSRRGDRVLAVERRAEVVDRDRLAGAQFRIAARDALELGERAGDLLGQRGRGAVDLGLGAVRDVGRDVGRIAEGVREVGRGSRR